MPLSRALWCHYHVYQEHLVLSLTCGKVHNVVDIVPFWTQTLAVTTPSVDLCDHGRLTFVRDFVSFCCSSMDVFPNCYK